MDLQSNEIYIAVTTIITALISILAIFITFVIVTQKKVIALQKKQLNDEIISIEKERERVASDLHDSLGSIIGAMVILNSLIETDHQPSAQIRDNMDTHLRQTSEQVRQIARNIIPRLYEDTTVDQVVNNATNEFRIISEQKDIELKVKTSSNISLSKEEHLHVYRIIKEILNNAYKHSQATIINLSCTYNEGALLLAYQDNGIGYDVQKQVEGLGLSNIQNRITLLNGDYSINSEKGKGTEIVIRIFVA